MEGRTMKRFEKNYYFGFTYFTGFSGRAFLVG